MASLGDPYPTAPRKTPQLQRMTPLGRPVARELSNDPSTQSASFFPNKFSGGGELSPILHANHLSENNFRQIRLVRSGAVRPMPMGI